MFSGAPNHSRKDTEIPRSFLNGGAGQAKSLWLFDERI
jgi:hypothetical protein